VDAALSPAEPLTLSLCLASARRSGSSTLPSSVPKVGLLRSKRRPSRCNTGGRKESVESSIQVIAFSETCRARAAAEDPLRLEAHYSLGGIGRHGRDTLDTGPRSLPGGR
jgi:hypothetical protein